MTLKIFLAGLAFAALVSAQTSTSSTFSTATQQGLVAFETNETLNASAVAGCDSSTVLVTRTSGTVLSVGNGASSSAIQQVRFGTKTRPVTAAVTLTISSGSGSGTVYLYGQLTASGTLQYVAYNTSGNTLAFSSGGVVVNSPAPSPAPPTILFYQWTITSGAYDTSGGTALQANQSCYLDEIDLANTTGSAVTVTITDSQSTPINLLDSVSIGANTTYVIVFPGGRYFDGGMQVTCGTANAIDARWRGLRSPNSAGRPFNP